MSHHPLTITAAATVAPRLKRFSVRPAYAGGPLRVAGYPLPVVVDLAGLVADDKLPVVLDHEHGKRVGHVDSVENSGERLDLAGVVSAAGSHAAEFLATAANSFPWQASIEALPMAELQTVRAGESVEVNGQQHSGPVLVSHKTRLLGLSFVTRGADPSTQVLVASQKGHSMSDTSNTSTTDPIQAERQRLSQIESACTGVDFEQPEHRHKLAELRASAIAGELPLSELQQSIIHLLRASRPQAHTVHATASNRSGGARVIEAAFAQSCGLSSPEKFFDEQTLEAADRFRGIGIQQLLVMAAAQHGCDIRPGERLNAGNIGPILRAAFAPINAAGFSTVNLPGLLSNVANKSVREGFASVDQTCLRIAGRQNVRDLKTHSIYSLTGDFEYEKIGPGGELKHATVGEETYTNRAETYGKLFAVSRQDILNDDLGALSQIPRRIGRGGMLKLNDVFWTAFLDNLTFFDSGNNNVSTGVLGLDGIAAAEVVFLNQTDPDGKPLGVMPSILLVPPTRKTAALTAMNSQYVVDGTATDARGSNNVFQGRFRVESSPYMENATYTGYSSAAYYLLADPAQLPVVSIAFLDGRESPTVETSDADFTTLGISMRGYHDFGVAMHEFRGGVRSTGA